ncbi:hypothetical protein WR25_09810 [Diploscapter pachys]|uniref:Uncharacterized protein n=1 Tax=Diploscapter pachys TaxID=2018661 RepID=A0A2A2KYX6_9BILA|nr:hypothetical protein WR25_09810 [Diploscapter pachys]
MDGKINASHQNGYKLVVSVAQTVPDDDHSDASGKSRVDKAADIILMIWQCGYGQAKHQKRAYDPVKDQRKAHHEQGAFW